LIALGIAEDEAKLTERERRWRRDARAGWLRLGIALILLVNLAVGETHADLRVHFQVVIAYAMLTAAAITLPMLRRGLARLSTLFIVGDALLVLMLFHEHLFATVPHLDHSLTAPSIAVSFLLLSHAALWLAPRLVVLFAGLVLTGWLSLATALAMRSGLGTSSRENALSMLAPDLALALAFAFAAFIIHLFTSDHTRLMRAAVASERRRANLSRFFSPPVAAELEARGDTLGLRRHPAAVMFVDLRSFSQFAEAASPVELAATLSEFRSIVADSVFASGGTIDKFLGDGVLALFGVPTPAAHDAARALRCAEEMRERFREWREARIRDGEEPLAASVGLHFGEVIAGVLSSGRHDEFTAIGDTVNVAERLVRSAKALDASIVASEALISAAQAPLAPDEWNFREVELDGRPGTFGVGVRRADP
jgi:adenylate cyclase